MAAGVELARRGIRVTIYEAAARLGGRARGVPHRGLVLDNGLHLLVGAYTQTLRLIGLVGGDIDALLWRRPLDWCVLPGFRFHAYPLPAPLHLATGLILASGASFAARISCLEFLHWMRRRHFRLDSDTTVSMLLHDHAQSGAIEQHLWRPLCIAALNTPPERASAQVFLNVLRDGLAAGRDAADLLLPRVDLTTLFPDPARRYIEARAGSIRLSTPVERIERAGEAFTVTTRTGAHRHGQVVVAVQSSRLGALTATLSEELSQQHASAARLLYEPITSVYLQYARTPVFPSPMVGLSQAVSQWAFDRGAMCGQRGLVGVVISASGPHQKLANEDLARVVHAELAQRLRGIEAEPLWARVIEEKRATFACVPDLERPAQETSVPGLHLAGDYTHSEYPATIEAAIRSGVRCAELAARNAR